MNIKPKIIISEMDEMRLEALLDTIPDSVLTKQRLEDELDRADIVDSKEVPPNVVTMNATVRFAISTSDEEMNLTLVYPKDMDESGEKISVLAPVGSALLGLSVGDEIEWPGPNGGVIKVKILEVIYQPEREGDFHL
ncbi:Regulator of nucleoside diphosphate kinase [Photobacterium marinum]|uniref:Regulator of nucleoside diphosphate kinase n=1 Tax=Photobacterium marinum TaxID=1056511 RepID=L8JGI9_9GAMM|nr:MULTISPECIES: nucleoside diphosphate kinase regulator [Photobacterium]ELR67935.1 Regulator of nucleoside diphosphate kinase [Photobacterium marinum]